ncbi:MAG: hypothetical protein SOZ80_02375 [Prevotella sp.]|uniref:hypothetical protein n=1 Tax=Prevotella sp. TaxID=59823 RepID=UPI002A29BD6A|nr:hypothetical protein [Prevotella sp.]MDD7319111.1 hypothetical protein [Prevotellaceae bacterium]MDY4019614.1 hypothetical protein [Prevotella sp.]
MNALKTILGSVYVILITLLLLMALTNRGNKPNKPKPNTDSMTVVSDTTPVINRDTVTPIDTAELVRRAEQIGATGELKITLLWNFKGDLDLHVIQPNETTIWFLNTKDSETGGFLDEDNKTGGYNSGENVFWTSPPKGKYKILVNYFDHVSRGDIIPQEQGALYVVIKHGEKEDVYQVANIEPGETINIATINI